MKILKKNNLNLQYLIRKILFKITKNKKFYNCYDDGIIIDTTKTIEVEMHNATFSHEYLFTPKCLLLFNPKKNKKERLK